MQISISEIKTFLINNADSIQKLATKHHKDYLGGGTFRSEIIEKYQKNHIKIVEELAYNLETKDLKKSTVVFQRLGITLAKDAVKDELTLEETVDGTIFIKQAVWKKLHDEKLLDTLPIKDFYHMSQVIGTYCDVVASKIAFTFHEDYIQKIHHEVKERKKSEELIQTARVYAENIVETVREPLLILDRDLQIVSANKSFYKNYQVTDKETIGKRIYELGNGQWNIPTLRKLLEEILPEKNSIEGFEVEHRFEMIGHKTMVLNARQLAEVQMILLAIDDITEQKKIEQLRDKYMNELGRSNKELEQFAYIASHDLKEPLRMVVSYLQLLDNRYNATFDDKAKRWIHFAVDGGKRMQILLGDLLTYSRIATKAKPLEKTNLTNVLGDVLKDLEPAIKESKVKIEISKLPFVMADPVQMGQLLQNLISNAIKFRNKRKPVITITSEHKDSKWIIIVKDNGIGIDKEYFEKIFTIFQRLHTREEYPGTGIGLAVCKKIIERHNGEIWVESENGKGAIFSFSIPDKPSYAKATEGQRGGDKK